MDFKQVCVGDQISILESDVTLCIVSWDSFVGEVASDYLDTGWPWDLFKNNIRGPKIYAELQRGYELEVKEVQSLLRNETRGSLRDRNPLLNQFQHVWEVEVDNGWRRHGDVRRVTVESIDNAPMSSYCQVVK